MQGFTVPDSDRIQPPQGGAPRIRQIIPPAPKAPPAPKTTYGVLSPAEVAKLGLPPGSYQRSSEGNIDKIADVPKASDVPPDPKDAIFELTNVIDKAKQARRKSNEWFATGALSGIARKFGGTEAANVQGLLDTVGSNTAFQTLQRMREASPTGGALGAISERELALLQSTVASLSPDQSDEQFQKSMLDIIKSYGRVLMKLPGGREEAIRRGWAVGKAPPAPPSKPAPKQGAGVIDFNDLPE